jgi:hypothetical protein
VLLARPLDDPRIRRTVRDARGGRVAYFVDLSSRDDVDETIAGWLAESWDECG